jgi:hypothetical protein
MLARVERLSLAAILFSGLFVAPRPGVELWAQSRSASRGSRGPNRPTR